MEGLADKGQDREMNDTVLCDCAATNHTLQLSQVVEDQFEKDLQVIYVECRFAWKSMWKRQLQYCCMRIGSLSTTHW